MSDIDPMEYGAMVSGISTVQFAEAAEAVMQAFAEPFTLAAPLRVAECPVCGRTVEFRSEDVAAGQWICHVVGSWFEGQG